MALLRSSDEPQREKLGIGARMTAMISGAKPPGFRGPPTNRIFTFHSPHPRQLTRSNGPLNMAGDHQKSNHWVLKYMNMSIGSLGGRKPMNFPRRWVLYGLMKAGEDGCMHKDERVSLVGWWLRRQRPCLHLLSGVTLKPEDLEERAFRTMNNPTRYAGRCTLVHAFSHTSFCPFEKSIPSVLRKENAILLQWHIPSLCSSTSSFTKTNERTRCVCVYLTSSLRSNTAILSVYVCSRSMFFSS